MNEQHESQISVGLIWLGTMILLSSIVLSGAIYLGLEKVDIDNVFKMGEQTVIERVN